MRLGFKEVNVGQQRTVPLRAWLARLYLWMCERLYDELAWQYDLVSWIVSAGQWRRWQAGVWREVHGNDVLEMGCGTGALLVQGRAQGLAMVGADRSPRMIAVAQRRIGQARDDCPLLLADGCTLPLANRTFDSVIATFPAGYILHPATLAEMRRVLRDDGRLVILGLWVEVQVAGLERLLPFFYGRPSQSALEAIEQRVEAAGFRGQWRVQRAGLFSVGVLVATRA